MNTLTGIENLVSQPRILNTPYWTAYMDSDDEKNRLREYCREKGATIEESEKEIRALVNSYADSGANLVFRFYPQNESGSFAKNRGFFTIKFYQRASNGAVPSINGIGAVSMEEIEKRVEERLTAKLAEIERQRQINDLIQKNKDLEQQIREAQPGAFERVIGRLEPVADILINKYFPEMNAKKAAGAIGSVSDEQAQKIAEESLETLSADDPNFHETLRKLAELKKTNPAKYNMAKSML